MRVLSIFISAEAEGGHMSVRILCPWCHSVFSRKDAKKKATDFSISGADAMKIPGIILLVTVVGALLLRAIS
jgi:hypothetical protein